MSEGTSWCGWEMWGVGWKVRDLSSICTWGVGLGARESFTSICGGKEVGLANFLARVRGRCRAVGYGLEWACG